MSGYLFFQIPGQHDTGVDKDRNKDRTYDGGFQPVFALGGVGKGEDQGQKIHAHQQYYAHEGQNPFEFTVFHSSVCKNPFCVNSGFPTYRSPFSLFITKKKKAQILCIKERDRDILTSDKRETNYLYPPL